MTAKELIQKLSEFPAEMNIVVPGYEGGFSDVSGAREVRIRRDANKEWYYGQHEEAEASDQEAVKAVVIIGSKKNG